MIYSSFSSGNPSLLFDVGQRYRAFGSFLQAFLAPPVCSTRGIIVTSKILFELHGEALEQVLHSGKLSPLALVLGVVMELNAVRFGLDHPAVQHTLHDVCIHLLVHATLHAMCGTLLPAV